MTSTLEAVEWALSKGSVGILSLVVLALVFVVKTLWEKNDKLQTEKDAIQALRLEDARITTTALLTTTEKTHAYIETLDAATELAEKVRDESLRRSNQ